MLLTSGSTSFQKIPQISHRDVSQTNRKHAKSLILCLFVPPSVCLTGGRVFLINAWHVKRQWKRAKQNKWEKYDDRKDKILLSSIYKPKNVGMGLFLFSLCRWIQNWASRLGCGRTTNRLYIWHYHEMWNQQKSQSCLGLLCPIKQLWFAKKFADEEHLKDTGMVSL